MCAALQVSRRGKRLEGWRWVWDETSTGSARCGKAKCRAEESEMTSEFWTLTFVNREIRSTKISVPFLISYGMSDVIDTLRSVFSSSKKYNSFHSFLPSRIFSSVLSPPLLKRESSVLHKLTTSSSKRVFRNLTLSVEWGEVYLFIICVNVIQFSRFYVWFLGKKWLGFLLNNYDLGFYPVYNCRGMGVYFFFG